MILIPALPGSDRIKSMRHYAQSSLSIKFLSPFALILLFVFIGRISVKHRGIQPAGHLTNGALAMQYSIPVGMLLFGKDKKMHPAPYKPPPRLMSASKIDAMQLHHLQAVVRASKVLFPEGTKVLSVDTYSGDAIEVNFNRAFLNPQFWQHHKTIRLACYSIVNNIGNMVAGKGEPLPVQILVEGKIIHDINGFDLRKPRKPDMTTVAKK